MLGDPIEIVRVGGHQGMSPSQEVTFKLRTEATVVQGREKEELSRLEGRVCAEVMV